MNISNQDSQFVITNECFKLKIIGFYCAILFVAGLGTNLSLFLIIYMKKKLQTHHNILVLAITALNFIGVLVEMPILIINNLYCR